MEKYQKALIIGALFAPALPLPVIAAQTVTNYETETLHKGSLARPITDFVNTEGKDVMRERVMEEQEIKRQLDSITAAANRKNIDDDVVKNIFPVTPELIKKIILPGTTMIKDMPGLPRPLFIIGNDKFSMQWFNANRAELERFQAAGIITKVDNEKEFRELQKAVSPLPLMPMSADALADELGVPGYPIMITGRGFFQ